MFIRLSSVKSVAMIGDSHLLLVSNEFPNPLGSSFGRLSLSDNVETVPGKTLSRVWLVERVGRTLFLDGFIDTELLPGFKMDPGKSISQDWVDCLSLFTVTSFSLGRR